MKFADVPRTLLRRWYLTLGGLILTLGMCFGGLALIPPTYEDKATVLLLPPETSLINGTNPYLGLSGLEQMVDVLTRALTSQSIATEIEKKWPNATFTVQPDVDTTGPIVIITVESKNARESQQITQTLLDLVPVTLGNLQSNLDVRARSQITSMLLTKYDRPEVVRSGQLRAVVAIAGLGLAGTALVVALLDGIIAGRRRKHLERHLAAPVPKNAVDETPAEDSPDTWWEVDAMSSRSSQ